MATLLEAETRTPLQQRFAADGFVIIDLGIADFDTAAAEVIAATRDAFDDTGRLENAWRLNHPNAERVRELALLPKVAEVLAELHGREAFPFQTLNFNRGTEQAIHSDTIHFDSTPKGFMVGVWIALEDIDAGNGPLTIYPGSHRLRQMTLADFGIDRLGSADPYELYRQVYEPGIARMIVDQGLTAREVHIQKGHALIWAANLLHGGAPIKEPGRSRHSQVTHYYFDGCSYHTPLLSDTTRIHRRYPVDLRTGRNVGGTEGGAPIRVPLSQKMRSWTKSALRSATRHRR